MRIIFSLLLLTVAIILIGAGKISTAQTPRQNQILYDFRIDKRPGVPKIAAATQRTVLSKVFPKYLNDESKCNSQLEPGNPDDYLKAMRNAGQIVPRIADMTTGSFTDALLTQTAYIISVGECGASHADNYGSQRMAIFEGQKLVADLDINFRNSILKKTDLNGDGVDELLLTGSGMNQGIIVETAILVDFKSGQLNMIEDFGQVLEDSCGSEIPGSESLAATISYSSTTTGSMPKFRMDNYHAACRRVKQWRFKSTGKIN